MDGSDHSSISSSTAIKRSPAPKVSSFGTGADENNQQMGMNSQNSKKLMTKHFMSPTISASSKAITPRKKILAERNPVSDYNVQNIQKCQNFDNSSDSLSHNGDSSLSPYDPSQNYPSPRPKFLRNKPDGRKEILLRCENEAKEREERSSNGEGISLPYKKDIDEKADLVSGAEEGFVKQEGEEIDEGDEEVEEEEEEKEGFLRRVFKLMLVLVVLVFSTLYISSMNSPEASPTLQAMEGFRDGYVKLHNHMYETMRRLGSENNFFNRMEFKGIVEIFEGGNKFLDKNVGLMKVNQTMNWEWFEEEEMFEKAKDEEISDTVSEVVAELRVEDSEIEDDLGDMGEKDIESIDKFESLQDNQIPIMSYAFQEEKEVVRELVPEVHNVGNGGLEWVGSEMSETKNIADEAGEVFTSGRIDNEITSFKILNDEEEELKEGLVEHIEADTIFKAVIGVAMVLAIIAPLVLAFRIKRKSSATKDSFPIISQSGLAEKCNLLLASEREEHIKQVGSVASPIPLISSVAEDSKELKQNRAPSVELLGEFVVGKMSSSSSFRSACVKSRMGETDVNNYSVSFNKVLSIETESLVPSHVAVPENISPSYEIFTPQTKKMKKEEAQKVVAMTPVRRSSRISSRAIRSP